MIFICMLQKTLYLSMILIKNNSLGAFATKNIVKHNVSHAPKSESIVFYDVFATPMSAIFPTSVEKHRKTHAFRPP